MRPTDDREKRIKRAAVIAFDVTFALVLAFTVFFLFESDLVLGALFGDDLAVGAVITYGLLFLPAFWVFFAIPLLWVELLACRALLYFSPGRKPSRAEDVLKIASASLAALTALELVLLVAEHLTRLKLFSPSALLAAFLASFACEFAFSLRRRARRSKNDRS